MKQTVNNSEVIERELLSWPAVTVGRHRFGRREFLVGKREIGHLHGSRVADLPFPRAIRDELIARGEVSPHYHVPDSGWLSFYFRSEKDIPAALGLFRRNYERIRAVTQGEPNAAPSVVANGAQSSSSAGIQDQHRAEPEPCPPNDPLAQP